MRRASAAAMQLELDLPIFRPGLRPRVGLKRARPCGRRRWDVRIRAATFERGCCQGCCPAGRLRRIELLSSIGSRQTCSKSDSGLRPRLPREVANQRSSASLGRLSETSRVGLVLGENPSAGRCRPVVWRSCRTPDARDSVGRRTAERDVGVLERRSLSVAGGVVGPRRRRRAERASRTRRSDELLVSFVAPRRLLGGQRGHLTSHATSATHVSGVRRVRLGPSMR